MYVRFTEPAILPSTLTAHKCLHIINGLSPGGVHACVLCWFSKKVICAIENVGNFLILVIHTKALQRKQTCFHCCWLARFLLKLYALIPLYYNWSLCEHIRKSVYFVSAKALDHKTLCIVLGWLTDKCCFYAPNRYNNRCFNVSYHKLCSHLSCLGAPFELTVLL